jgi:ArsR family transcriptional regulator, arsenate/arsenite/antimonite-responsive transcriptional repressor
MGLTKTEIFSEKQNELATIAKVLAHPARIAILDALIKSKQCICGDLVTEIGLAQATISQHLKELKNTELIKGTITGTSMCYCINAEKWNSFQEAFRQFFNQSIELEENPNQNCC